MIEQLKEVTIVVSAGLKGMENSAAMPIFH